MSITSQQPGDRFQREPPVKPPAITGESTHQQIQDEVRRFVSESVSFLEENPTTEDRVEFKIGGRKSGLEVKVWHTKINTKGEFHLGYKVPWQSSYREVSVDDLIEHIVQSDSQGYPTAGQDQ